MLISELIGVKSKLRKSDVRYNVEDRLRENGFVKIGEGGTGSVFSHPNLNYVLKLFDVNDSAYLKFINFSMQHSNPHFPQFRGKPIKLSRYTNAIRMEKLKPWDINYSKAVDQGLETMMGLLATSSDWREDLKSMNPGELEPVKLLFKKFPDISNAIELMVKFESIEPSAHWDLHEGNVMKRGNVFVFTDPFSV